MLHSTDTIAALSTAPGEAGISIVRMSGPESLAIADRVFQCAGDPPSQRPQRTFVHGYVRADVEDDVDLDEVILLVYRAPCSYTREDVIEFQGHGGRAAAARVLRAVLNAGARHAEPGEFTRRAFLNGRIDLLQAEAVLDLIRARCDRSAEAAVEQLEGRLSCAITEIYDAILSIAADVEATLDFDEEEVPASVLDEAEARLREARDELVGLLSTWEEGRVLREGARVVIAGQPNVGKSTLFNGLVGTDRAIVTDIPGTTRDTIEESVVIEGIPLRLTDTAGLRDAECLIERHGVARARDSVEKADLVLYVVDASQPLRPDDQTALAAADPSRTVIVLNKADLDRRIDEAELTAFRSVWCILLRGEGLDDLRETIVESLGVATSAPAHAVISERHRHCIQSALSAVNEAHGSITSERPDQIVLAAKALRDSLKHLGAVTGRIYTNELLDKIFSRFCIGK